MIFVHHHGANILSSVWNGNLTLRVNAAKNQVKFKFSRRSQTIDFVLFSWTYSPEVDTKCDVFFSRLKRFKFEKIKKNEFRPDYGQIGPTLWLKIRNLNSICVRVPKRTKTSRYFCLKDKVFWLSKTGCNLS